MPDSSLTLVTRACFAGTAERYSDAGVAFVDGERSSSDRVPAPSRLARRRQGDDGLRGRKTTCSTFAVGPSEMRWKLHGTLQSAGSFESRERMGGHAPNESFLPVPPLQSIHPRPVHCHNRDVLPRRISPDFKYPIRRVELPERGKNVVVNGEELQRRF